MNGILRILFNKFKIKTDLPAERQRQMIGVQFNEKLLDEITPK